MKGNVRKTQKVNLWPNLIEGEFLSKGIVRGKTHADTKEIIHSCRVFY